MWDIEYAWAEFLLYGCFPTLCWQQCQNLLALPFWRRSSSPFIMEVALSFKGTHKEKVKTKLWIWEVSILTFSDCFILFNNLPFKHLYFPNAFACQKQKDITKSSALWFKLTSPGEWEHDCVLGEKWPNEKRKSTDVMWVKEILIMAMVWPICHAVHYWWYIVKW